MPRIYSTSCGQLVKLNVNSARKAFLNGTEVWIKGNREGYFALALLEAPHTVDGFDIRVEEWTHLFEKQFGHIQFWRDATAKELAEVRLY